MKLLSKFFAFLLIFPVFPVLALPTESNNFPSLVNNETPGLIEQRADEPYKILNPTLNNGPVFRTYNDMFMSNWFRSREPTVEVVAFVVEGGKHYQFAVSNTESGTMLIEIEYGPARILTRERVPISSVLRASNNGTVSITKSNSFGVSYTTQTKLGVKLSGTLAPSASISSSLQRITQLNRVIENVQFALDDPASAVESVIAGITFAGVQSGYNGIRRFMNLPQDIWVVPRVFNFTLGYNFRSEGGAAISNSRTFAGSTSCSSEPNGAVQMFSDISLTIHPGSRARLVWFLPDKNSLLAIGPWEAISSNDRFPQWGVVGFDNTNGIGYSCSTNEEDFVGETSRIFNEDNPGFDLVSLLTERNL